MTRYALWQQLGSYPAAQDRLVLAELWPTPGVLRGMAVTVGAGRVVNIAAGSCVVAIGAGNGSVLCVSDAVEQLTFAAAPGSGSSRVDLIVAQVRDSAIDAGGNNDWIFAIVQGTPATTPTPPAVPARAVAIAQVTSVGGQANLAQSNIAPYWLVRPGPPLEQDSGVLASNVGLAQDTGTVYLQTHALSAGLWMVHAWAAITGAAATGFGIILPGIGNAGGSVPNVSGAGQFPVANGWVNPQLHFVATITSPGGLTFQAVCTGGAGSVNALQPPYSWGGATGYTAYKIG